MSVRWMLSSTTKGFCPIGMFALVLPMLSLLFRQLCIVKFESECFVPREKRLLLVVVDNEMMTVEVLVIFMVEIERILNDKPLSTLADDLTDQTVLTSIKLMIQGDPCVSSRYVEISANRCWHRIQ